jgi:diguanylate cyclase (GGDEF)-like protein
MPVQKRTRQPNRKSKIGPSILRILPDGIILLDGKGRIIEINPAAEGMTRASAKEVVGKTLAEAFPAWLKEKDRAELAAGPLTVPSAADPECTLEFRRLVMPSTRGKSAGSVLVLRDVSDRIRMEHDHKRAMELLLENSTKIQALNTSLRAQAIRDPVTGLYNKCYCREALDAELARAARSKTPVGILKLKLDQFEKADERFGDKAGVEILKILSSIIYRYVRKGDIACRFAESEFLVVLPGAPAAVAGARAEQLRRAFHDSILNFLGSKIECTFSCGVAAFPDRGVTQEVLMQSVDEAMRESAAAGGNRVTVRE